MKMQINNAADLKLLIDGLKIVVRKMKSNVRGKRREDQAQREAYDNVLRALNDVEVLPSYDREAFND